MLLQTRESSSEGAALSPPASTGGQEKSPALRVPRGTDGAENNPRAQLLGVQAAAPASWGLSPTLPTWGVFVPSARPGHRAAACTGVQWVHTHTPPCAPSELCSADVAMLVHLPGVVGSSGGAASTRRGSPPRPAPARPPLPHPRQPGGCSHWFLWELSRKTWFPARPAPAPAVQTLAASCPIEGFAWGTPTPGPALCTPSPRR